MLSIQGIGATNSKASGIAVIHQKSILNTKDNLTELEAKTLFSEIKKLAIEEINMLIDNCDFQEEKEILAAHELILNDPEVNAKIYNLLKQEISLTTVLKNVKTEYMEMFNSMSEEIFSSKALDVEDVFDRLLLSIKNQKTILSVNKNFILVCDNLLPTMIYDYPSDYLKGIVVRNGSLYSHGIIIAKARNIPVVIGLRNDFGKIKSQDYLIVDGFTGKVIILSE